LSDSNSSSATQRRFEDILDLDLAQCNVVVCLASQATKDDPISVARVQLGDGVTEEFKTVVRGRLDDYRKDVAKHDAIIRPYAAGSKPDPHEIEHLLVSETDLLSEQIKTICPLDQCDVFDGSEAFVKALRFYLIVATPKAAGEEPIYFFRAYTPKRELSRSTSIPLFFANGQFNKLRETTFLFDRYLDCIVAGDDAFILNTTNFQRIFRFFEKVVANAEKTLREIEARIPIKNFTEFANACKGHFQMSAKLNNIAARGHLNSMTLESLKATVASHGVAVTFEIVGGQEQIVFDPKNKWELLRLLDDDYLDSPSTGNSYEATGKRPRRRPAPPAPSNAPTTNGAATAQSLPRPQAQAREVPSKV